jgi:hypothetical protein
MAISNSENPLLPVNLKGLAYAPEIDIEAPSCQLSPSEPPTLYFYKEHKTTDTHWLQPTGWSFSLIPFFIDNVSK